MVIIFSRCPSPELSPTDIELLPTDNIEWILVPPIPVLVRAAFEILPPPVAAQHAKTRIKEPHPDRPPDTAAPPFVISVRLRDALSAFSRLGEGCSQADLAAFFREHVFPRSLDQASPIQSSWSVPLAPHLSAVCLADTPQRMVDLPPPQLLCGYSSNVADGAFSPEHVAAQEHLQSKARLYTHGNSEGLSFPFLEAEFVTYDVPTVRGRDISDVLNHVAIACTGAVKIARRLNTAVKLRQKERLAEGLDDEQSGTDAFEHVPEMCHGIILSQESARVYVTWAEDMGVRAGTRERVYYIQRTNRYELSEPEDMDRFIQHVHNIAAWGITERLGTVRAALEVMG